MHDSPPAPEPVSLADFVVQLTRGDDVQVVPWETMPAADEALRAALQRCYAAAQEQMAEGAPAPDLAAAEWAAVRFYRACQFLVCREVTPEQVTQELGGPCPLMRTAEVEFAVDLIFRFLPDLHDRARRLAPEDPLVAVLMRWAREWPLSSVGIRLEAPPTIDRVVATPGLWRLYVDRVTERAAEDRWRDPRVAAQLRADLGAQPDLAPGLASALARLDATAAAAVK